MALRTKSHWHVGVKEPYMSSLKFTRAERDAEKARVRAVREKLKEQGFKTEYFYSFYDDDPKQKAQARKLADAMAETMAKAVGAEMDVAEGFFLF